MRQLLRRSFIIASGSCALATSATHFSCGWDSPLELQAGNGREVSNPDTSDSHTQSSMQAAARLIRAHIPFGVITKSKIDQLDRFKVLILSNVHMMDEQESETIRQWVRRGGKLIASGGSSLVTKQGKKLDDFMLGDVLGVRLVKADWADRVHYLIPTEAGAQLFPEYNPDYPAYCNGLGFDVALRDNATVLAYRAAPWPRRDASHFSSIHSDPPWIATDFPELVENRFGDGVSIYCASLIELLEHADSLLVNCVRRLESEFQIEVDAPACVEVTAFEQADRGRYILCLLNFQKELPNIPIDSIGCRVNLPRGIREVRHIPSGAVVRIERVDGSTQFVAKQLQTLLMYEMLW